MNFYLFIFYLFTLKNEGWGANGIRERMSFIVVGEGGDGEA